MVLLRKGHSLAVQILVMTLSYCFLPLFLLVVVSPGCYVAGEEEVQSLVMKRVMEDDAVELKRLLTDEALAYDINAKDGASGQTALMRASLMGSSKCVETLLELGADVTIPEKDGYTPMHGAGFQGRAAVAKLLIDHGVNVNDVHTDGKMPIHRACWGREKRHTVTAGMLLEHGACLAEDGSWGCDHPSSMTQYHHTYDILDEYFRKRGGSTSSNTPVDEL